MPDQGITTTSKPHLGALIYLLCHRKVSSNGNTVPQVSKMHDQYRYTIEYDR